MYCRDIIRGQGQEASQGAAGGGRGACWGDRGIVVGDAEGVAEPAGVLMAVVAYAPEA